MNQPDGITRRYIKADTRREKTESLPCPHNKRIHVSRNPEIKTDPYDGESTIILRLKPLEHDRVTLLFILNSIWV